MMKPLRITMQIRPDYYFDVSCQGSCPQAIEAFLEGESYEDVVMKAISIGGDSDTIACMAGGIAEAFYGLPEEIKRRSLKVFCNEVGDYERYNNSVLYREYNTFLVYLTDRGLDLPKVK